jgi:hypothetical protein
MSRKESKKYLLQERCIRKMHKERGKGKSSTNESIKKKQKKSMDTGKRNIKT